MLEYPTLKCKAENAYHLTKNRRYKVMEFRDMGRDSTVCVLNDQNEWEWYFIDPTFEVMEEK